MKRLFLKTLLATVTAALSVAAPGLTQAQTKTIKFVNQNAKGHPIVLGMDKFAEIVAGVALAGEISLAAAISSLDWVSSHEKYGRNR